MSEEITFEAELDKLLDEEPFRPFWLIVTSGDRYEIASPRQIAVGGSTVVVMRPRAGTLFFRKNQIVGVDVPAIPRDGAVPEERP